MSRPMHDIDNDESIFQFDSFDGPLLEDSSTLLRFQSPPSSLKGPLYPPVLPPDPSNPQEMSDEEADFVDRGRKGKEVSMPVPIPTVVDNSYDVFDMSPSEAGPSSQAHVNRSSFSPSSLALDSPHHLMFFGRDDSAKSAGSFSVDSQDLIETVRKGKSREHPPTLPPLAFSPTEFGYGKVGWPSPGLITPPPGPSSYESAFGSLTVTNHPNPSPPKPSNLITSPLIVACAPPNLRRVPSRRRSLSSLSSHPSPSLPALPSIKGKVGSSKGPSNIARKLLFKKREDVFESPTSDQPITPPELGDIGSGSCLMPWRGDSKTRKYNPAAVPFSNLGLDVGLPVYLRPRDGLKGKARSYSSPLPLSALDLIPVVSPVISEPVLVVVRNYFEEFPKELRLQVLSSLVTLHEAEYQRWIRDGQWTALMASSSKNRWVGRDRGIRELVKFSRVSKSWQALVFDGQLWQDLDLRSFPRMPTSLILRLAKVAGAFVRALDMSGHAHVLSATFTDLTDHVSLNPALTGHLSYTQLTSVNLWGCAGLTTRSLHHLLIRSPSLQKLCLKGLSMVTNTTCDVLAVYCPHLTSLDLTRCSAMDGSGIQALAVAATSRGEHLLLKELRLSGLKHINDATMAALGKAAPYLEVLDLSYVRHLHNSSLEALVSCEDDGGLGVETVLLTSREAGRDAGDSSRYRRRVTRLRHISLSSCVLLTDIACSNLAFATPRLEFLEMAGIGAELKDPGLVHLLKTTPFIRKLDLEDASDITDAVISAITPSSAPDSRVSRHGPPEAEPGHDLEHLCISYAMHISNDALLALVRGCPRLKVLEADNTHMSGLVLREFVRLASKRQAVDAKVVAVDCRGMGENLVKELSVSTRPRLGWRSYDAKRLKYLDGRDGEDLKVGQDECDNRKVVLKTFYSWQTVDAVRAAREKRRKLVTRRVVNDSIGGISDDEEVSGSVSRSGRARWWSPVGSGRRLSGANSPAIADLNTNDGCRIM